MRYSELLVVDCSHYALVSCVGCELPSLCATVYCWLLTALTMRCIGCRLPSLCTTVSCWLWTALTMRYTELYWLRTAITVRYSELLVVDCSHYVL